MDDQLRSLTYVNVTIDDQIATLTINNPPVNVLNDDVLVELSEAITFIENNDEARALIVTGAGEKAFIAGADIKKFPSLDEESGKELAEYGQRIFDRLANLQLPVICAINGVALGGGCELALACDIRVAQANAKIGLPEVGLGLIPGYGGTQRLPRLIGPGKAKEIIFSGGAVSAEEAYRIGLVEQYVEEGSALEAAKQLAGKIITKAPLAIAKAKQAINEGIQLSLDEGQQLEANNFGYLFSTEDKNEGTNAFLEKRRPEFKGK